jgi:N-acyl homoserine lactone hydrolase
MMKALIAAAALALATTASAATPSAKLSLTRLDCGTIVIDHFNEEFSDTQEYPAGPHKLTDSCYVIRHGSQVLLWDTGLSASLKGHPTDLGLGIARLDRNVTEQLSVLGLKPSDISIVGISHMHPDHTGQASAFPRARLVIGKRDFELTKGKDDPFGPWRAAGAKVTLASGDIDIFGDASVVALHTPGHTPDHLSLLVKLASGPVLLTGDLYHATIAREKRGVPVFNTSRADTLASMDRFERLAKQLNAKVIIQHEPNDIAKLPAFPEAAE